MQMRRVHVLRACVFTRCPGGARRVSPEQLRERLKISTRSSKNTAPSLGPRRNKSLGCRPPSIFTSRHRTPKAISQMATLSCSKSLRTSPTWQDASSFLVLSARRSQGRGRVTQETISLTAPRTPQVTLPAAVVVHFPRGCKVLECRRFQHRIK